jgi:hypothetical protein
MALGLSFGKNKTKTTETTNTNATETGTQQGTSTTNSTNITNQSQQGTSQSSSTGTSNTAATGVNVNTGTGTQAQSEVTNLFADNVLGGLTNTVMDLLTGGSDNGAKGVVHAGLSQMGDFDVDSFVQGTLARAQNRQDSTLSEALGGIFDAIGGKNNSAAALLSGRMQNDAAANLAGIEADARARGAGILQSGIQTAQGVAESGQNFLANLLGILKGGTTSRVGETQTRTAEQQTSSNTANTATTEANRTAEQQTSQTNTVLQQILEQLMKSNTQTQGTSTTVGTSSKSGGGISI